MGKQVEINTKFRAFLDALIKWFTLITAQIPKHGISIFMLILLYIILWHFPQTKDLLLILNQSPKPWVAVFLFFSSLTVFAFLIGNADNFSDPNMVSGINFLALDTKEEILKPDRNQDHQIHSWQNTTLMHEETSEEFVSRMFPKVLGTILILIVAFAALNSYSEIQVEIEYRAGVLFLISLIPLLLSLNKESADIVLHLLIKYKLNDLYAFWLCIILVTGIIVLGFFNQGGNDDDIFRLFTALLLLAIFFFIVTTSYSKIILIIKYKFGAYLILTITSFTLLIYCGFLDNPQLGTYLNINPLTTINICLLSIFSMLIALRTIGGRIKLPLVSLTLIFLVVIGIGTASSENFDHYDVSFTTKTIEYNDRPELHTYIKKWLDERYDYINTYNCDKKFKVIFVSSEGGGSRAGLWSFLVNSYLYEKNPDYFDKHLFSMTGASGGMVGNSMFHAVAKHNQQCESGHSLKYENDSIYKYKASEVYSRDYLSTSLTSLFGRDFFQSILGFMDFKDRGELLEIEWENAFSNVFKGVGLDEEFLAKQNPNSPKTPPLLIVNTVNVEKGNYSLISPVDFSKDYKNLNVFDDFLNDYDKEESHRKKTIKYSTAMSLAARFPYISPVGRVRGIGQFMDAGYYDNIGGTVTRRLQKTFDSILFKDTTYSSIRGKVSPVFLTIANKESNSKKRKKEKDSIDYRAQIIAPAIGVLNATFWHAEEMNRTFGSEYLIESERVALVLDKETQKQLNLFIGNDKEKKVCPELPLGRYLSKTVIRAMEQNLDSNSKVVAKLEKLLNDINN